MKYNKRPRRLMRVRNKNRVNRLKNQQVIVLSAPLFFLVLISLKIAKQNTPEKVLTRLRMHIEKLTNNLNFPITDPAMIDLQTMETQLTDLIDMVNAGNKGLIPNRNAKEKDAKEMIRQLSYNILFLSEGDEVKIKSAGFDVRKPKANAPAPGQVLKLVAKAVGEGKIRLTWAKEPNSTVYVIEQLSNPVPPLAVPWKPIGKTRRASFLVEGLTPGVLYSFRVFGTNGDEDGNPSDPAEQRSL